MWRYRKPHFLLCFSWIDSARINPGKELVVLAADKEVRLLEMEFAIFKDHLEQGPFFFFGSCNECCVVPVTLP